MLGQCKGGGHGFGGVLYKRIGRVHIQVEIIRNIGRNTAARKPADIGQAVLQTGKVMQVLERRGAI